MDKNIAAKASFAVIVIGLLAIATAFGDDFLHPTGANLQIHSETVLSGVGVYPCSGKIEDVIQKLGKPLHTTVSRSNNRTHTVFVDGTYEWQTKNWRLRIRAQDELNAAYITQVDVWGTHADAEVGTTGRGLELGDAISDARRTYGLRSYFGTTITGNNNDGWAASVGPLDYAPTLTIDFDKDGKINHMRLTNTRVPLFEW
jgi:hypothetical protein